MKNPILFFLITIILSQSQVLYACTKNDDKLKIGVISDIHYLSPQLMDNGEAINNYATTSGKSVKDVPEVLDSILTDYLNSEIDILLITGDLTKDGEKQSHLDLSAKFKALQDKGIRIFVIPGNHDINMPNSVGYKANETYRVENINSVEFTSIYSTFGYDQALDRDDQSLSYVAELNSDTWLLAIDASRYDEYTDKSISGGRIKSLKWIIEMLGRARNNNKQVIGMMHHGLVEHFQMQSILFSDYLVEDWQIVSNLLADNSLNILFTGHFHANDITQYKSFKGNEIYDIETGSVSAYPFPYRFVELTKDSLVIKTKNIIATENNSHLAENSKMQLKTQAERRASSLVKRFDNEISNNIANKLSKIAAELFIRHLAGDETLDDSLMIQIDRLKMSSNKKIPFDLEQIELDFFPADNNTTIIFDKK